MKFKSFFVNPAYFSSFVTSFFLASLLPLQVGINRPATNPPEENPVVLLPPSLVDFESYLALAAKVYEYRKNRLLELDQFLEMSKDPNVIILDTRSETMYKQKHLKGAIHLNFSDFTQENLSRIIPGMNTKILIYCNNNFANDDLYFPSKIAIKQDPQVKPLSLALNVPTFINLYGYGYRNVYELSDLVDVNNDQLVFEGESSQTFPRIFEK